MEPRGSITRVGKVQVGAAELTGRFDAVIVRVRADSTKLMRKFSRFCALNGIVPREVEHRERYVLSRRQETNERGRPLFLPNGQPRYAPELDESGQPLTEDVAVAYECVGSLDALEGLIDHPAVLDWYYRLNVSPPRFTNGIIRDRETGIRQNVSPPPSKNLPATVAKNVRRMMLHKNERELREERERLNRVRGQKSVYHADNVAVARGKAERLLLDEPEFQASDIPALTQWFLRNTDPPKDRASLHG
jgi:hypothetical protein